jgi:hypothetical protein
MFAPGFSVDRAGSIDAWMTSIPRQDFVGHQAATDGDPVSYGCAILFIYYLHTQLGIPLNHIATARGVLLEDKFQTLTLRTNGFDEFNALMESHFPRPTRLATDDPFPLLPPSLRSVYVSVDESVSREARAFAESTAEVSPGFPCPPGRFEYKLFHNASGLTFTARISGFAVPVFSWRVNGIDATTLRRGTVVARVNDVSPTVLHGPARDERFNLGCYITGTPAGSILEISNYDHPGDVTLVVELDVQEQWADAEITTRTAMGVMHTVFVLYEEAFYAAQRECARRGFAVMSPLFKRDLLWRIMPDPPPEARLSIAVLAQLVEDLHELQKTDPELAAQGIALLQDRFGAAIKGLIPGARG